MTTPTPVSLVGATGLTGSETLKALLSSPHPFAVTTFTRREPNVATPSNSSTTYKPTILSDLTEAISQPISTPGGIYISCLGTTRAQAGSFEAQIKIDLDLNRDLAKKAKEDGAKVMILVSSGGANPNAWAPYTKMKGQLEEAVKEMGFDKCVILRPGLLMGARGDSRPAEYAARKVFGFFRAVGLPTHYMETDASAVGECIASLAANPPQDSYSLINNSQIIEIAKKWREANAAEK